MIATSAVHTHDPGGKSKPHWPIDSKIRARFSECGRYRYELEEVWTGGHPRLVMWLMMNPSVARIEHADPTLIRTGRFSRTWGFGGQLIGNVYAYRATNGRELLRAGDPAGPGNDAAILAMAARAEIVVLAYGQLPTFLRPGARNVVNMLRRSNARLTYLRLSKDGTPQHPLYLPGNLEPQDFI